MLIQAPSGVLQGAFETAQNRALHCMPEALQLCSHRRRSMASIEDERCTLWHYCVTALPRYGAMGRPQRLHYRVMGLPGRLCYRVMVPGHKPVHILLQCNEFCIVPSTSN